MSPNDVDAAINAFDPPSFIVYRRCRDFAFLQVTNISTIHIISHDIPGSFFREIFLSLSSQIKKWWENPREDAGLYFRDFIEMRKHFPLPDAGIASIVHRFSTNLREKRCLQLSNWCIMLIVVEA